MDIRKSGKKHLSLILRFAIAGLACWFVFKDFDVATLVRLRVFTLLLAVGLFAGGVCLIGFRWWVFLRAQAIRIPVLLAIKLTFVGQFFTNFMPSSVGGDIARAWYITRYTPKKMQAVIGVAADRIIGLISTAILAVFSYFIFLKDPIDFSQIIRKESGSFFENRSASLPHVLLVVIILVGFGFILSCFFDFKGLSRKSFRSLAHVSGQFKEVLRVYVHHPWILVFGLGLTIFLQSIVIFSLWLIGQNLGMSSGIQYYFIFFPMMWVISSLPLSIAGLGIMEGGLVLLFVQFTGAEEDAAKALALCQRLTWILASLPGMVVHLAGVHRSKDSEC
jgi:uncharacterized protein (TIRG00374 family)